MGKELTTLEAWKPVKKYVIDGEPLELEIEEKGLPIIESTLKNYELVMPIIDELCGLAKTNDIDEMIAYFEKSLKALEIIKKHKVNVDIFFDIKNYEHYCNYYGTPEEDFPLEQAITQEEYDLLKEELL